MRESLEIRIKGELDVERRYADLSRRLVQAVEREAARARVTGVEKVLDRIDHEDQRLGRRRPDVVTALRATVAADLKAARVLRLRRDQWLLRQDVYQDYQRMVGSQFIGLVKARASLEAIRRLDGPKLGTLQSLRSRLSGGADRLERLRVPDELRATHDLIVGAWRFAENATRQRVDAVASGNLATRVGGVVGGCWRADDADARPAEHSRDARAAQTPVITPRTTRLIRVADLGAFRTALASLACQGPPLAARDRLILVPSQAAGRAAPSQLRGPSARQPSHARAARPRARSASW